MHMQYLQYLLMIKFLHATSFTTLKFSWQVDLWLNEGILLKNVETFRKKNCLNKKNDHFVEKKLNKKQWFLDLQVKTIFDQKQRNFLVCNLFKIFTKWMINIFLTWVFLDTNTIFTIVLVKRLSKTVGSLASYVLTRVIRDLYN